MGTLPLTLPAALRAAGLQVVEVPGWQDRAYAGSFDPVGVTWHHDASGIGPSPAMLDLIAFRGTTNTPPPLSQIWVSYTGVWYIIAAGRANHAGKGDGWLDVVGRDDGNRRAVGIEVDHTVGEDWPTVQITSLRVGTAVLLRLMGRPARNLFAHREYAPGRKVDPAGLDMASERSTVAALINNLEGEDMFTDADRAALNDLRTNFALVYQLSGQKDSAGHAMFRLGQMFPMLDNKAITDAGGIAPGSLTNAVASTYRYVFEQLDRKVNALLDGMSKGTTLTPEQLADLKGSTADVIREEMDEVETHLAGSFDALAEQLAEKLGADKAAVLEGLTEWFSRATDGPDREPVPA